MELALELAARALHDGEPPFGAVIVDAAGMQVAAATDQVCALRDWTQHAEINAVRAACAHLGADLEGCTLVTTVEPCPMCFTASWLARISRLVFGATMTDVARATGGQQRELVVPAHQMNLESGTPIELVGGVLSERCIDLFARK